MVPYKIYTCAFCGKDVEESWPHIEDEGDVFCGECAFYLNLIDEKTYLDYFSPMCFKDMRAAIRYDRLYLAKKNEKFPWERTNKDERNTQKYADWRKSVFERDSYTCVICGKVGGKLNAHHIKPFAKYKNDRHRVSNGVTLCEQCHKKVHNDKDPKWIKGVK